MRESIFRPRQYVEGHKSLPVVLSRLYHPTKNDYTSTYGVWNDDNGRRGCGLWDDVIFQNFRNVESQKSRSSKRYTNKLISRPTISNGQLRFDVLAAPKRYGCGPNCKASRCAAIEYAKSYYASDKQNEKKKAKKIITNVHLGGERNIYTTMANICVQDRIDKDENHNITMGLKNLKKINAYGDLEGLSTIEQIYMQNSSKCSNAPQKSLETTKDVPKSTSSANNTGLKSLIETKTIGSNTKQYYFNDKDYEIPLRVLKDLNNNVIEEIAKDSSPPTSRVKIPTSLPRVALLRPPKPKPYKNLNKLARKMIESTIEKERISTPQPKPWNISSPNSLTSRRTRPRKMPPETQKLMPGKLAPRLFTPPTSIPFTQTASTSPHSQQGKPQKHKKTFQQQPILNQIPNEVSKKSSKQSSDQSSNSLMSTISYFETTSEEVSDNHSNNHESLTPMYCLCSLCGKSESVPNSFQTNSATIYHNNPLYSPLQSLTRQTNSNSRRAMSWRLFYIIIEVLLWMMFGGALTLGLIPYVESLFKAYVADYCRCSNNSINKGSGGPHMNADGMQGGIVKWVTCMMDDNRMTLTPLK